MDHSSNKYKWFALGDLNGFFGLMFDNLTVLSFLAGTLVFVFKFPADIVYTKMFPGTAFGVSLEISSIRGWRFDSRSGPDASLSRRCPWDSTRLRRSAWRSSSWDLRLSR